MQYEGRKEINYVLVEGHNDRAWQAEQLAEWARAHGVPVKINQLQHPTLRASSDQGRFVEIVRCCGAEVEEYRTDGFDIQASCGMMTYRRSACLATSAK
jgi:adenine C2-methylase RlmN of 23S rRNA A2503 and tRNA A37